MAAAFARNYLKVGQFIDPRKFSLVNNRINQFCLNKGFQQASIQHLFDEMVACDDPQNMRTFKALGTCWPLIQTGQMGLEDVIMDEQQKGNPAKGFYCQTTSYRFESNPVEGRHMIAFPLFEVEHLGGYKELHNFQRDLLIDLGYEPESDGEFPRADYADLLKEFGVDKLENEHEAKLGEKYPIFSIDNFPTEETYWNMKLSDKPGYSLKTDVIVGGVETIGSAERSCDIEQMHDEFYNTAGGEYAEVVNEKLGEERMKKRLNKYLHEGPNGMAREFIERSGMGIGMCRLIDDMDKRGLIDRLEQLEKERLAKL